MHVLDEIRAKRDEIYAIARKHNVEKIYVFGWSGAKEFAPDTIKKIEAMEEYKRAQESE